MKWSRSCWRKCVRPCTSFTIWSSPSLINWYKVVLPTLRYRAASFMVRSGLFSWVFGGFSLFMALLNCCNVCVWSYSHYSRVWFNATYLERIFVKHKLNPADLVGAHEIADRLGVAYPQMVHEWKRRHADFPRPVAKLTMGLIWDWKEIETWAKNTNRLK